MDTQHDGRSVAARADVSLPRDPDRALFLIEDEAPAVVDADSPRRRLADRVALDLVEPPPAGVRNEADTASLTVSIARIPGLADVLTDAPLVVGGGDPNAVRVARGRGGVVIRLHGAAWSVVFRIGGPVFVVMDEMPDHALRVSADPDWQPEVRSMVEAVVTELDRLTPVVGRPDGSGRPGGPHVVTRY